MSSSASLLLKLASRLLSLFALILFLQTSKVEAGSASAQLGVTARVVRSCRIATSPTGSPGDAQGVGANLNLNCSGGFSAVNSPSSGGITAGQTSTGGNDTVSYTISEVTSATNDTKTLTINF